jgi:Skp family chaperone for outer membrane proteins
MKKFLLMSALAFTICFAANAQDAKEEVAAISDNPA